MRNHNVVGWGRPEPHAWTNRSIPTTADWRSIAWSPTLALFVAVGYQNASPAYSFAYSEDGKNWTAATPPSAGAFSYQINEVIWSTRFAKFIACSNGGAGGDSTIFTSPDGVNWTGTGSSAPDNILTIVANDDILVAFCAASLLYTTTDLVTWDIGDAQGLTVGQEGRSAVWNGSIFCVVGDTGVITSPDGLTWTTRVAPTTLSAIAWSEKLGLFAAVSGSYTDLVTSPNGITWTARTAPADHYFFGIAAAGVDADYPYFCAVGSDEGLTEVRVATSADGITWTSQSGSMVNTGAQLIAHAVEWSVPLELFCAVGTSPVSLGVPIGKCMTSTKGA